jgi:hypothetical protein
MDHPVKLSLEELLDDVMDWLDPDAPTYGIARKILGDPDSLSDLTPKQRYHWDTTIVPAIRRESDRRDAMWNKALMEREI